MSDLDDIYQLILEFNKLKEVFRNTITSENRKESTAEHSWSASMIVITMIDELKKEFGKLDELKIIRLILIHDIVEIYAEDVMAYDVVARMENKKFEAQALEKVANIYPAFGVQLQNLWYEFEATDTIESKIAKAADAICPMFQRLHSQQSYVSFGITLVDIDRTKRPIFEFSQTFTTLYEKLRECIIKKELVAG